MPIILSSMPSRGLGGGVLRLPPPPIALSAEWFNFGDSETAGREPEPTAVSPPVIFEIIYNDSGLSPTPTNVVINGSSGRWMEAHIAAIQGTTRTTATPWINTQESGNQNQDGQRTPAEWYATMLTLAAWIQTTCPGSLWTHSTANNFQRVDAYRVWDEYNELLPALKAEVLSTYGVTLVIVEADFYVKALVAELTYDVVCFPNGHANQYHYQGIGNFIIALAIFRALGHDVTTLDHSGVDLDAGHKATAVAIVAGSEP